MKRNRLAALAAASLALSAVLTGCGAADDTPTLREQTDLPPLAIDSIGPDDYAYTPEDTEYVPETMSFSGSVLAVDAAGAVTLETEQLGEVVCNTDADTIIVNAVTGRKESFRDIRVASNASVSVSRALTRSVPPQTICYAVITGLPESGLGSASYIEAREVLKEQDGTLEIMSHDEDLIVTIPAELPIEIYGSDGTASRDEIMPGSRLVVWYDAVSLSLPGQATAVRALFVPQAR